MPDPLCIFAEWECPLGLLTSERYPCRPPYPDKCNLNAFPHPRSGKGTVWAQFDELDVRKIHEPAYHCKQAMWPSIKSGLECGPCKVLVDQLNSRERNCDEYCSAIGRACRGAWEASNDNCIAKSDITCSRHWDKLYQNTSGVICECSTERMRSAVTHTVTDVSESHIRGPIRVLHGYPFTDFTAKEKIEDLPKIFFECGSCAGGANFSCKDGQAGRLCSSCAREPEKWSSILGKCQKCNNDWRDYCIGIGGTGAVVLSWVGLNALSAGDFDALDIALHFTQILSVVQGFNVPWAPKGADSFPASVLRHVTVIVLESLLGCTNDCFLRLPVHLAELLACGYCYYNYRNHC